MPIIGLKFHSKKYEFSPSALARVRYSISRSQGKWKDHLLHRWQGWGFLTRWQRSKFIDLILNLQSENAHNMLCLLMGESPLDSKQVLRLTFESDQPLPLDCVRKRDDWITKADYVFTHKLSRIAEFLSIERSTP